MPFTNTTTARILIVENNRGDLMRIVEYLEQIKNRKFESFCFSTLQSGLDSSAVKSAEIILLDLDLPDSFGIDTLLRVQERAPSVPIIVLTDNRDEALAIQAINSGAQDYLIKSELSPSLLNRSISYAIERHRIAMVSKWSSALVENFNYAFLNVSTQGDLLSWNRGAEKIFGYTAQDITGASICELIPNGSELTEEIFCLLKTNCSKTDGVLREANAICNDGRNIIVEMFASPIQNNKGDIASISLLMRDVTRERKLEMELDLNERRLKFAAESAKLGLWDWDATSGKLRLDDGMLKLLEFPKELKPTLGAIFSRIHSDDRKLVERLARKSGPFSLDLRLNLESCAIRYVQLKGEVFTDELGDVERISGLCLDITERKQAEDALRLSEANLLLALDASQMGIWELSLETRVISRSVLHNDIFGVSSEATPWSAKAFMKYVHAEDLDHVRKAFNTSLESGRLDVECRVRNSDDGSLRWIALRAVRTHRLIGKARMIGTIRDITESKKLELIARQAQERSDQILQAVVEYAPTGVALLDAKMELQSANYAFTELVGQNADVLKGWRLEYLLPYAEVVQACADVIHGKPVQLSRLSVVNGFGEQRFWDIHVWPMNVSGKFSGAVLQLNDRTHKVLLERQKDDFVASVAHDIKNPLLGAARLLEVLCAQAAQAPAVAHERYLTTLRDSTQNLLSLVQNLVDVYRYEALTYPCHPEPVQTPHLFESCVNQMNVFAESRDVTMHIDVAEGAEIMNADAIGIRRVLMNLLHNAIKFNKPSGTVLLSVKKLDKDIVIGVSDTGFGISSDEQKNLFKRFSQNENGRSYSGGTGLGLYLSKQIVSAHGGSISCQSVIDQGTSFEINLPNFTNAGIGH